jgi:solute carrier family 30 (zinc transporter), member 9
MAGGSRTAIYAALTANSIVAVAKFAGFFVTGSGSMLSEGVHSIADVGNQSLLAIGMNRSEQAADSEHPEGYGREAFVWSLVSAVGMFFLGCGVSVAHGVQSLMSPHGQHDSGDATLNLAILFLALIIEGASCAVAVVGLKHQAKAEGQTFMQYIRTTDDPFGIAVLLEDGGAVLGVLMALGAVGLTALTHDPRWDAVGSILIGLLLGAIATYLVAVNRTLLVGKAVRPGDVQKLTQLLADDPAVESVLLQRAIVTGTNTYSIRAEIDFDGAFIAEQYLKGRNEDTLRARATSGPEAFHSFLSEYSEAVMEQVGDEIDRIEADIREAMPKATQIDLEPD